MSSSLRDFVQGLFAIAYRELLSLFVTPLGYVVGTLFLLQQGWNFALLLRVLNDPLAAPGPVMQYYFGGSFFIFWLPVMFVCAAISMRLLAEERKQGTLEALLTAPLHPAQVVLGKYLGAVGFYGALWLPTGVFYVLLRGASVVPDHGPILSGYLGTAMVGASFLAIGLLSSAIARSQLAAAIATFVVCTILLLSGLLVDQITDPRWSAWLERTSLLGMMQELAQGIVDTHWLWLHAAFVVLALGLAIAAIDPRRSAERWVQLGLVALVCVHAVWWGTRHRVRSDWTGARVYSLSDRAREVLLDLEGPIDVRVVVPSTLGAGKPNPLAQELREVLSRMTTATSTVRARFIDPDRDRQEAEQWLADFGLTGRELADGVVLVRAGQGASLRKAHVLPHDLVTYATGVDVQVSGPRVKEFRGEEALLSAFVEVTHPVTTTVCYTRGHGEPDMDGLEPFSGYAHLHDLIRSAGITTRVADLSAPNGLNGCDIVLVAGPGGVLPPAHVQALEQFAERGGDLLLLTGAVVVPGASGLAPHGLEPLARRYGVVFGDRIVVDPHPMPGGTPLLAFTLVDGWGDHPAVRNLVAQPISMVFARELALTVADDGSTPTWLLQTSDDGWAEADIQALRDGRPLDAGQAAEQDPMPLAVAAERGGSRIIVIASDQFALNAYLREDVVYDRGRDLIINALGWLGGRDVLLGLRPRAREHVKLVLLDGQLWRMTLVCVLGLPLFWALLGLWVLWGRARR